SLALLKLHAYQDRRARGERKDIQDFDWFLRNYESPGNEPRIHNELGEPLRDGRLEIDDAGAALLGLDVAKLHPARAIAPIRDLLVHSHDPLSRVIGDVLGHLAVVDEDQDLRRRTEASRRFEAFAVGL